MDVLYAGNTDRQFQFSKGVFLLNYFQCEELLNQFENSYPVEAGEDYLVTLEDLVALDNINGWKTHKTVLIQAIAEDLEEIKKDKLHGSLESLWPKLSKQTQEMILEAAGVDHLDFYSSEEEELV